MQRSVLQGWGEGEILPYKHLPLIPAPLPFDIIARLWHNLPSANFSAEAA